MTLRWHRPCFVFELERLAWYGVLLHGWYICSSSWSWTGRTAPALGHTPVVVRAGWATGSLLRLRRCCLLAHVCKAVRCIYRLSYSSRVSSRSLYDYDRSELSSALLRPCHTQVERAPSVYSATATSIALTNNASSVLFGATSLSWSGDVEAKMEEMASIVSAYPELPGQRNKNWRFSVSSAQHQGSL